MLNRIQNSKFNPEFDPKFVSGQNPQYGFTLLELLIAITILGTVILILGGAIRLGMSSVDKGEREVHELERFRSSVLVMDRQTGSATQTTHYVDGEKVAMFRGDERECVFVTSSSLWGRKDSFIEVTYSIEEDEEGRLVIKETERLPGEEGGLETIMLDSLEEAEFAYLFLDTSGDPTWVGIWEEKDRFPEAIALHVKAPGFEHNLIFPLMAKGKTSPQLRSNKKGAVEEFRKLFQPFRQ